MLFGATRNHDDRNCIRPDALTIKAKAQNVLDETIEIERAGVITFEEKPGATLSLSAFYKF